VSSPKAEIIQMIYDSLWDSRANRLSRSVVTLDDVARAIRKWNSQNPASPRPPSDRNPANFFKDFTRRLAGANAVWPRNLFDKRITARQVTGKGNCFEFIPFKEGQTEAFPVSVPPPSAATPRHDITSAVLPVASRNFGRADEPWLLQVAVRLRIIESHLSLFSVRKERIRQVDHLQNSVKLNQTEIDAVFLALEEGESGSLRELLITCEAKRENEDLNMEQLMQQPRAAFRLKSVKQDVVIPMAIKTVGASQIHVIEFAEIMRADIEKTEALTISSDSLFTLRPSVPGIGKNTSKA